MTDASLPGLPDDAPTFADVVSAAERLAGVAHRTPVLTSTTIDRRTGAQVFFKAEPFQRMGAFKFRGAYNAASRIAERQPGSGVIAGRGRSRPRGCRGGYLPGRRVMTTTSRPPRAVGATVTPTNW
jgi:hypothetical protein